MRHRHRQHAGRFAGRPFGPLTGRLIVTVVPSPGMLSIDMVPSCSATSPLTSDRPRPGSLETARYSRSGSA